MLLASVLRKPSVTARILPHSVCRRSYMTPTSSKSASYILIGDEILSGCVQDTNGPYLAKYFRRRGIDLTRIEVIPDKIDVIVETVNRMRSVCDYVVTSGGIGPTHDDVTYEAVAKAFGVPLAYDATTLDKMAVYMAERNSELNEARKRMALFPQGCRTYFVESALWVPVVMMDNVHIYPGVPRLFERMITGSNALFEQGPPFVQYEVFTRQVEGDFAEGLTQVATAFPSVKIGSYPHVEKANKYTRLFIEGRDETLVKDIVDQLAALTAAYAVKHVPVDPPAQAKL